MLTAILVSCSTYLLGRSQSIKDEIEKMKVAPKKEFVNIMNNAPIPQEARIEKKERQNISQEEIGDVAFFPKESKKPLYVKKNKLKILHHAVDKKPIATLPLAAEEPTIKVVEKSDQNLNMRYTSSSTKIISKEIF